jgi:uncharacterized protein
MINRENLRNDKMPDRNDQIKLVLNAIDCLSVYRKVFDDQILGSFRETLSNALKGEQGAMGMFSDLLGRLLELEEGNSISGMDLFRNHLLDTMLGDENAFSLAGERKETDASGELLIRVVKNDLRLLKIIYDYDLIRLIGYLGESFKASDLLPAIDSFAGQGSLAEGYPQYFFRKRSEIKKLLAGQPDWENRTEEIRAFYRDTGSGIFGRYWAFKWGSSPGNSGLIGIAAPDQIRLEDLVGYEDQQEQILRNTDQFVKGFAANNMLLYGDRGTGKSSTIKSLIHIFGPEGLRIVEVSKHDLLQLHEIIGRIKGRAQRFIVFIDDLSFEESETEYKDLKALLEGSVEKPPENVLVYATSNRRNLVREYFRDRDTDEVGKQDTYQEKLSLADRFGIKLVFPTPDKWQFLRTVEDMALKSGITMDKSKLHSLALEWVMWHNSRSGRTARQFINDLRGRLDLEG